VDQLQYELGEGPCIDVIGGQRVVHSADAARDGRWPRLCHRVAGVSGAVAVLSSQLAAGGPGGRRTLGSLNLYADRAGAFDAAADHLLAVLVANHAAAVIDGAHREDQLRQAIASRDIIGQAKGILMASGGIDPDAAFDQLRMASQRTNVKLRDLARQVVDARRSQADSAPPPAEAPWS
jgi:hypothetical protein